MTKDGPREWHAAASQRPGPVGAVLAGVPCTIHGDDLPEDWTYCEYCVDDAIDIQIDQAKEERIDG